MSLLCNMFYRGSDVCSVSKGQVHTWGVVHADIRLPVAPLALSTAQLGAPAPHHLGEVAGAGLVAWSTPVVLGHLRQHSWEWGKLLAIASWKQSCKSLLPSS